MNSGKTGQLKLDDTGEVVGPGTLAAEFAESKAAAQGTVHYHAEFTEVELGARVLEGTKCAAVTLRFVGPRLTRIDVMLPLAGDEKGWANWTVAGETKRKKSHEEWLERVFGVKLGLKAIDGIVPFEPDWEYPRHAMTEWGEVASYYDSKGGFPYACVHYGPRDSGSGS